jgi:hypothetical protein
MWQVQQTERDGTGGCTAQAGCGEAFPLRNAVLIGIASLAALNSVVFGFRLASFLRYGDLYVTSGGDAPRIYGIWKIQEGHPLYEWPFAGSFQLCQYNYLFYHFYARLLSAVGVRGANLPVGGGILTLLFAVFGALAQ